MRHAVLLSEFVVNVTFVINHHVMVFQQEKRDNKEVASNKSLIYRHIHRGLQAIMQRYIQVLKKAGQTVNNPGFLKQLKERNTHYSIRLTKRMMNA